MPLLTCSSWPQDGCRSSWHCVLLGSSKGRKGAIRPFPCPETPTPDLPLKLAGQSWEIRPDRKQLLQKALPRKAEPNPKLTPTRGWAHCCWLQIRPLWVRRARWLPGWQQQGQPQELSWGLVEGQSTASWASCPWGLQAFGAHRRESG